MNPSSKGPEQSIYLRSPGGHALSSSDLSSNIDSWGYSWAIEAEGGFGGSRSGEYSVSIVSGEDNTG